MDIITNKLTEQNNETHSIMDIVKSNQKSNSELKNILSILVKNFQNSEGLVTKKLEEIELNQKIQKSKNEELEKSTLILKKCVNGYLFKYIIILNYSKTICQCLPGYTGDNCDVSLSCDNECYNNGICKYGKCYCKPGFSGILCNITEKCINDCFSRGKCLYGKCFCDAGYSGIDCQVKDYCQNDCSNHGLCFRSKCMCEPGYTGTDCSKVALKFEPCKNNCSGRGLCKLGKCFCYPGTFGEFCEIKNEFVCPPVLNGTIINSTWTPCNGKGICKYGMCFCFPGFKVFILK
jgi:hypothetical protein